MTSCNSWQYLGKIVTKLRYPWRGDPGSLLLLLHPKAFDPIFRTQGVEERRTL